MEAKEILTPKNMLVALGTIVIVMSLYGMANGDEWAEIGWGEDNVQRSTFTPSVSACSLRRSGWASKGFCKVSAWFAKSPPPPEDNFITISACGEQSSLRSESVSESLGLD